MEMMLLTNCGDDAVDDIDGDCDDCCYGCVNFTYVSFNSSYCIIIWHPLISSSTAVNLRKVTTNKSKVTTTLRKLTFIHSLIHSSSSMDSAAGDIKCKYEHPLIDRYASKEMSFIWSPAKKFSTVSSDCSHRLQPTA